MLRDVARVAELGSTAVMQAQAKPPPTAWPWNAVVEHLCGILFGWLSVVIVGAQRAPGVMSSGDMTGVRLASATQVTPEGRAALVRQMLTRQVHEAPMYWLQLVLATAVATLGLVLNSDVVIIAAMLMSPLVTPIVELGMGLAVGLPSLAARSFVRAPSSGESASTTDRPTASGARRSTSPRRR